MMMMLMMIMMILILIIIIIMIITILVILMLVIVRLIIVTMFRRPWPALVAETFSHAKFLRGKRSGGMPFCFRGLRLFNVRMCVYIYIDR